MYSLFLYCRCDDTEGGEKRREVYSPIAQKSHNDGAGKDEVVNVIEADDDVVLAFVLDG